MKIRVCYFGTYREKYSRNKIMIEGLRRNSVEVIECHETLWHGIEDRVQATSGGWRKPAFWRRVVQAYLSLIWRYFQAPDHDLVVVGYPGQFDVYLARLLSWLRGKPLVWDVFMSIYLISLERGLDRNNPFTVNWIQRLERWALRLPDLLIHDTAEYTHWLSKVHGIDISRFRLVPTGADDRYFQPATQPRPIDGEFRVVYYGTFIANHGVRQIIEAAQLLANETEIRIRTNRRRPRPPGSGSPGPEIWSQQREFHRLAGTRRSDPTSRTSRPVPWGLWHHAAIHDDGSKQDFRGLRHGTASDHG